jgi:transcriptional regulator with XRE-family HTH domain
MAEGTKTTGRARRERLSQRRKALGLTQEDLAALLDVERTTVARWERGQTEPGPWIQPKLAKALRIPAGRLEELLHGNDPDQPMPVADALAGLLAGKKLLIVLECQVAAARPGWRAGSG